MKRLCILIGLFRLHNWSFHVSALNSLPYVFISLRTDPSNSYIHSFSVTSMTATKAKVGFATLGLPLLPLSLRNHRQTCFICLGSERAAVSTENPPVCLGSYSSYSRENTDGISFMHSSRGVAFGRQQDCGSSMVIVLLSPASQTIYLTHHKSMPAGRSLG